MKKMVLEHAYFEKSTDNHSYMVYYVTFELLENTVENIAEWEEFFKSISSGQRLRLTIENLD